MTSDEKLEIIKKRDYLVVKHNKLIQHSRYDLSVAEQRAVAYICSMIKPADPQAGVFGTEYQLEYEFNIRDYARVCGLPFGGKLYRETKAVFKRLMMRIIDVELDGDDLMLAWLDEVRMRQRNGNVKFRLNPGIAPFLFDLQNNFTAYGLLNILAMKSQYSIRIYEFLHSHAWKGELTIDIDIFKQMLMIDEKKTYDQFPPIRRKVLDPAMEEINKYTDLEVRYEPITQGKRKVIKILFRIVQKNPLDRHMSWGKVYNDMEGIAQ